MVILRRSIASDYEGQTNEPASQPASQPVSGEDAGTSEVRIVDGCRWNIGLGFGLIKKCFVKIALTKFGFGHRVTSDRPERVVFLRRCRRHRRRGRRFPS